MAVVVVVAAAYLLMSRGPSFTISVSPSAITIPRGGSENITVNYSPNVPFNLGMSSSASGPSPGIQVVPAEPPFKFAVVVPENAAAGTYMVTMEATDMDTGARATTTFTVNVT